MGNVKPLGKLIFKINDLLSFEGNSRSQKAKKNIVLLFAFNLVNFAATLLLVPLTLNYLGTVEYGVWLTISSVLMWFSYFDFGIGNGLRNKLAETLAENYIDKAKVYVSTAYAIFGSGILALLVIFYLIYGFIDWTGIFNAPQYLTSQVNLLIAVVFALFSLQLFLKLIYSVSQADQRPAVNGLLSSVISICSVLFLFIIYKISERNILILGAGLSLIPVVILLMASLVLFLKFYKKISPAFKNIQLKYSRELVKLGMQFFVIQLSSLVLFATDNLIITQIFGPADVTTYNIAYKLFYFIPLFFNIILTPFWSAYTEAYVKEDFQWIRNSASKIVKLWILLSIGVIALVFLAEPIYKIWVGSEIKVPFYLSVVMGIFVILSNWNNIFAFFINGVGKIRLQFYSSIFVAVINIPLSIYFAKSLGMGITGVMTATCICVAVGSVWAPIQYSKIINRKAAGIWNK